MYSIKVNEKDFKVEADIMEWERDPPGKSARPTRYEVVIESAVLNGYGDILSMLNNETVIKIERAVLEQYSGSKVALVPTVLTKH